MPHRLLCALFCSSLLLWLLCPAIADAGSLRFFGNGTGDIDRVKIQIDDPSNSDPGPPIDVGAGDLTIEFWMRGADADNDSATVSCGAGNGWINGNILLDRDRFNQGRNYGLSISDTGEMVWGIMTATTQRTIGCGGVSILDNAWHHIAAVRRSSDGFLWLFVDGALQDSIDGPDGDISYPDDGTPCTNCCTELPSGPSCTASDPFIVLGAEKHDAGAQFPSFSGYMDELRYSTTLRYTGNFTPPSGPFATDGDTVGLYHMDEGTGTTMGDSSEVSGSVDGTLFVGGSPTGPLWSSETPFDPGAGSGVLAGRLILQ